MIKRLLFLFLLLPLFCLGQFQGGVIVVNGVAVHQPDTSAYKVINTIQQEGTALNGANRFYVTYLVSATKAVGFWDLTKAFYGFVGGTAASHKWNWKNMLNTDNAFRISFGAGTNHSSTGVTATTNSSNTFLNPSLFYTTNIHLSYYSGTNSTPTANNADIGFYAGATQALYMSIKRLSGANTGFSAYNESATGALISYPGRSDGFFLANRQSNSRSYFSRFGTIITQSINPGGTVPNGNLAILGIAGTGATFSPRQARLITIGNGLNDNLDFLFTNIATFAQSILNRK